MYFTIKIDRECRSNLGYTYFNTIEEITNPSPTFEVSSKVSSTSSSGKIVTSTTLYFTIEKKSGEYKPTNGDYLYLEINCKGKIDFENTEKDGTSKVITTIIVVTIVFVVVAALIVGITCYCVRKRRRITSRHL